MGTSEAYVKKTDRVVKAIQAAQNSFKASLAESSARSMRSVARTDIGAAQFMSPGAPRMFEAAAQDSERRLAWARAGQALKRMPNTRLGYIEYNHYVGDAPVIVRDRVMDLDPWGLYAYEYSSVALIDMKTGKYGDIPTRKCTRACISAVSVDLPERLVYQAWHRPRHGCKGANKIEGYRMP